MNIDIKSEILKHMKVKNLMVKMYNYYKGEGLEIEKKQVSKSSKTNNKLKNPFGTVIIDQKNGYLMGNPIRITLNKESYQKNIFDLGSNEIRKFLIRNNFDDLAAEMEKMSSICGYSGLLNYTDKEGRERIEKLNGWNLIFLQDGSYGDDDKAIYYYPVTRKDKDGNVVIRTKAELYENSTITFYIQNDELDYVLDNQEAINPLLHNYDYNPLIEVSNNDERMGDFQRVIEIIDAYNNLLSSSMDEVDTFRLAYMLVTGAELDEETMEKIKETGAFSGLDPEDKIEFITKTINDTFIENTKRTLNDNIYKFSGAVDLNDEKFSGGGESGESRKWKLIGLENKAAVKARKFESSLRKMFKVVFSSWAKKGLVQLDYLDIDFQFSRNFPVDLLYLADVSAKLKGQVSEDSRLKQLGELIGDDIELEKERMKKDSISSVSLNPDDPYDAELMK